MDSISLKLFRPMVGLLLLLLLGLLADHRVSSLKVRRSVQDTADYCTTSYSIPPFPEVSMIPEGLVVRDNGSHVFMTCNVQMVEPSSLSTVYTIHWEFNGTVFPHNSTTLELVAGARTTGQYRCIVAAEYAGQNTSLVTAVSSSTFLELPRLNGWIDAKPTNQSQTITNIHLPKGGLTVLECQPSTNNPSPSDASVSWVRDKVPVGEGDPRHLRLDRWRLLVLNFSLEEPKKEARYKCIVSGLEHFNEDLVKMYTLFISEDAANSTSMVPESQELVAGSNATFYCFASRKELSNVTWWKDGRRIDREGLQLRGAESILWVQEALVVRNVSAENEGVYSCMGADRKLYNATLTVVSTPRAPHISALNALHISNKIITGGSEVNLTCHSDSRGSSDVLYKWFLRGVAVSADRPSSAGGSVLSVGPRTTGSVTCSVANKAGVASTSVILLDRPLPPTNLSYGKKLDNNYMVVYGVGFLLPEDYFVDGRFIGNVTAYATASVRSDQNRVDHRYSTAQESVVLEKDGRLGGFDVPVQHMILQSVDGKVIVEVKLTVFGHDSDSVRLKSSSGQCEVPVHIDVIEENFLTDATVSFNDPERPNSETRTVGFTWNPPKSAQSGFLSIHSSTLNCTGQDKRNLSGRTQILDVNVTSCVHCTLTVTYSNIEGPTLTNSITFYVKPTAPVSPAELTDVSRVGNDGRSIDVTFNVPHQTCEEAMVDVIYPYNSYPTSSLYLRDNSSCKLSSTSSDYSHTYKCRLVLQDCWQPNQVQFKYRNWEEVVVDKYTTASPPSNIIQIPNITQGDIKIRDISVNKTGSTWVDIQLDFSPGLACLLGKTATLYQAHLCWERTAIVKNSCNYNWSNCMEFRHPGTFHIKKLFTETIYTFYAIVANGSGESVCSDSVLATTTSASLSQDNHNMSATMTMKRIASIMVSPVVLAAALVALIVVVCICCSKNRKKMLQQHRHRLSSTQDDFQPDQDLPVDVLQQNRMETLSERTSIHELERKETSYMLKRYMMEQPDGSEQETLTTDDDYTSQTVTEGGETSAESDSGLTMESDCLVKSGKDSCKSRRTKTRRKKRRNRRAGKEFQSQESILERGELDGEDKTEPNIPHASTSPYVQHHQVGFQVQPNHTPFPLSPHQTAKDPGSIQKNIWGDSLSGTLPDPLTVTPPTLPVMMSHGEASGGSTRPLLDNNRPANMILVEQSTISHMSTAIPTSPTHNVNSSGYISHTTVPTLYRASSSQTCTSGYVGSSMCSSSGYFSGPRINMGGDIENTSEQSSFPDCLLPGEENKTKLETRDGFPCGDQPIFGGTRAIKCESSATGKSHFQVTRTLQDGSSQVEKTRVEEECGSLSSDSVFSESGISFEYAPTDHVARLHPSEGYHSMSTTPREDSSGSTDYVNVDLKQIEDVHFHMPLNT